MWETIFVSNIEHLIFHNGFISFSESKTTKLLNQLSQTENALALVPLPDSMTGMCKKKEKRSKLGIIQCGMDFIC